MASRIDQGCTCLVLGFCSAWSSSLPCPPASTPSLSKGDTECRNKYRKLTLWGRKCHIRSILGLAFDRKGSWKMAWEIMKEWQRRKGKWVGTQECEKGKKKQWSWSNLEMWDGGLALKSSQNYTTFFEWPLISFLLTAVILQVLLLPCPTVKSSNETLKRIHLQCIVKNI